MGKRTSQSATGEQVPTVRPTPFDPANVRMRTRAWIDPSRCARIGV